MHSRVCRHPPTYFNHPRAVSILWGRWTTCRNYHSACPPPLIRLTTQVRSLTLPSSPRSASPRVPTTRSPILAPGTQSTRAAAGRWLFITSHLASPSSSASVPPRTVRMCLVNSTLVLLVHSILSLGVTPRPLHSRSPHPSCPLLTHPQISVCLATPNPLNSISPGIHPHPTVGLRFSPMNSGSHSVIQSPAVQSRPHHGRRILLPWWGSPPLRACETYMPKWNQSLLSLPP